MLVYGSQQYEEEFGILLQQLRRRAAVTRPGNLDELRTLLIQTGQLEQGVADLAEEEDGAVPALLRQRIDELSELAATAFCAMWRQGAERGSVFSRFVAQLASVPPVRGLRVTIKVPEGFEYYALFPEQYCQSAIKWAAGHADARDRIVLAVGIRSIGTTLSAVVAATLVAEGWRVRRITVRPAGHPFERTVKLPPADFKAVRCALLVDEGPGLSGSSLAAAKKALQQAGINEVCFLPGHDGSPGLEAPSEVRQIWADTRCYVSRLEEVSWAGRSLPETMALQTGASEKRRSLDLSGGRWRARAFRQAQAWPAVCARFERLKFLVRTSHSDALLWKFAGLGAWWPGGETSLEIQLRRMASYAEQGFVPMPLKSFRGFIAVPWIDGPRLGAGASNDASIIARMSRYLQCSAGEPLRESDARQSRARLSEMLCANTREALGNREGDLALSWAVRADSGSGERSYTDGRMAPYEWVRTKSGECLKLDSTGNDTDHTCVGRQPVLWDVAGALVEWNLSPANAPHLLKFIERDLRASRPGDLTFYQMAYSAFRMGITSLCAGQLTDAVAEKCRLERASRFYRDKLAQLLKIPLRQPAS